MRSLLSKFTPNPSSKRNKNNKKNPYSDHHHPSHVPLPPKPPAQHLRPASPRESHNFLPEARLLINRDPVTGRAMQSANRAQVNSSTPGSTSSAEPSAYLTRALQLPPTSGKKYDIVTYHERKAREEQDRVRRARGGVEFYAPERQVGEFYGGGVGN